MFFQFATLLALGTLTYPTVASIKSSNTEASSQGAIQGALGNGALSPSFLCTHSTHTMTTSHWCVAAGIKTLASGAGPIVFSSLYSVFTSSGGHTPFLPQAPFIAGALMMVVAAALALWLPNPDATLASRQQEFLAQQQQQQQERVAL